MGEGNAVRILAAGLVLFVAVASILLVAMGALAVRDGRRAGAVGKGAPGRGAVVDGAVRIAMGLVGLGVLAAVLLSLRR